MMNIKMSQKGKETGTESRKLLLYSPKWGHWFFFFWGKWYKHKTAEVVFVGNGQDF